MRRMAEEWMGHLKASECKHKEKKLKQQFICSINEEAMTAEIIKDLTAVKSTSEVTSKPVL